MRIVFMGTPEFAVPALRKLAGDRYDIAGVYTQPDRTAGRGRGLVVSPVKQTALKLGLNVVQPVNFRLEEDRKQLALLKPRVIVVAAYGIILPPAVLKIPDYGCLNIHPSILPKYRGVAPVPAAILNGDEFTGVSIMQLDRGVDTGPVLMQTRIPVDDQDTTGRLTEKLAYVGAHLLMETLTQMSRNKLTPQPQDPVKASYTKMLIKKDGMIDWNLTASLISRQIRAYQPWPGSYSGWRGKQLKFLRASVMTGIDAKPGEVIVLAGGAMGVGTASGVLVAEQVQLEGKKIVSGAEFIRGQKYLPGEIIHQVETG